MPLSVSALNVGFEVSSCSFSVEKLSLIFSAPVSTHSSQNSVASVALASFSCSKVKMTLKKFLVDPGGF